MLQCGENIVELGACLVSHDQGSFTGNPLPHHLFMSQLSPMDGTQRPLGGGWHNESEVALT